MELRKLIFIPACALAFLAVLAGSFGAHALADLLEKRDAVKTWDTAVRYQMWHALAMLLLAFLPVPQKSARAGASFFLLGIVLFSGSLYAIALGGPSWLGPVTPIGGLALLSGWLGLLLTSWFPGKP